jgi:hypothetical protein
VLRKKVIFNQKLMKEIGKDLKEPFFTRLMLDSG